MRRALRSSLGMAPALAAAVVMLAQPASTVAAAPASGDTISAVLQLTNAQRANAGLAPLALEAHLVQEAQSYAQVLASGSCFDHTCGPVPDLTGRANQAGYTGWVTIGENIAGGYPTPQAVVDGWMASPGHRANILSPDYTEIGIGEARGSGTMGTYWAQEFGARSGAAMAFQALPDPNSDQATDDGGDGE